TLHQPTTLFDSLRQGKVPDLFIIGAEAEGLADLRMIAELCTRPETETAPIIVIGSGREPEFGIMALDLGAGDILRGGFDADELVLRLRAHLRRKRQGEDRRRHV